MPTEKSRHIEPSIGYSELTLKVSDILNNLLLDPDYFVEHDVKNGAQISHRWSRLKHCRVKALRITLSALIIFLKFSSAAAMAE